VTSEAEPDEPLRVASDAVAAPQVEAGELEKERVEAPPSVEIVDDTPMAPPEQIEQLVDDAAETREETDE
jgi:hypothetical protein